MFHLTVPVYNVMYLYTVVHLQKKSRHSRRTEQVSTYEVTEADDKDVEAYIRATMRYGVPLMFYIGTKSSIVVVTSFKNKINTKIKIKVLRGLHV